MSQDLQGWDNLSTANQSFGVLCRKLLDTQSDLRWDPFAAGVCVHPEGVILTCLHALDHFIRSFTPYSVEESASFYRRSEPIPVETHEAVHFAFLHDLNASRRRVIRGHWRLLNIQVFKVCWAGGDYVSDLASLLIGPTEGYAPLPSMNVAQVPPLLGQRVFYIGHHRPTGTPVDHAGQTLGFAVAYRSASVVIVGKDFFLIDAEVLPGMSGGPVVDPSTGALLGIICEAWPADLTLERVGLQQEAALVVGQPHMARHLESAVQRLKEG